MPWPSLDSGKMRHFVTILQQVSSTDASGETVSMQPLYANVAAELTFVKGIDVIKSGQVTTQTFLTAKIWWQAGILANMQVQGENGLYLIQSIDNVDEMNIVLILNCLAMGRNE
jgi:head-tail adaptor